MTVSSKDGKTFLLVMDIENTIMDSIPDPKPLLSKIEMAIIATRKSGATVVCVQPRKERPTRVEATPVTHHQIEPLPTDIIVQRNHANAFVRSDLAIILLIHKAESLVFSGFLTSGLVFSTLRKAADKNRRITVLSDACADPQFRVHELLVKSVFPFYGEVITTDAWASTLN